MSLDALRGFLILNMVFGFTLLGGLPEWMYHAQDPPRVGVPGIGWRDLAYPGFLFAMAAAIPFMMSRRIARGQTELGVVFTAGRRAALLLVFALIVGHSDTYNTAYTSAARMVAILGFGILWLIFMRPRPDWDQRKFRTLNRIGWLALVPFLLLTPPVYGKRFSFGRFDIIILDLAFTALVGAVLWYFTRGKNNVRVLALGLAMAMYLGAISEGWMASLWWTMPVHRLILLSVIVPGIIAGDLLLEWIEARNQGEPANPFWARERLGLLAVVAFAFTPIVTVGLHNRWGGLTTQVSIALIIAGLFLVREARTATERMLRALFLWGSVWVVLGLLIEPFQGGITKNPGTLSYFFVVAGLTMLQLVSFVILADVLGFKSWFSLLADVGQNAMLGYVLFSTLLNSALYLIPSYGDFLSASPGEVLLRGIVLTAFSMWLVAYFTRRRILWGT